MVHKLQTLKNHVEHKSRKAIKVLLMDNENIYVDKRLRDICKLEGIDLQNPLAFSLHKKNVTTLRIQTVKSMESCMIQAKTHEIFVEKDVHFEESSPRLPLILSVLHTLWKLIVTSVIVLQQI